MPRLHIVWSPLVWAALNVAACAPRGKPASPPPPSTTASSVGEKAPGDPSEPPLREANDGLPRAKTKDTPLAAKPIRVGLRGGLEAIDASDYDVATAELTKALQHPNEKAQALVGLARVALAQGHYAEAVKLAEAGATADVAQKAAAAWVKAEGLARQGKVDEAIRACKEVESDPEARRARLTLGGLLLRKGKRVEAEPVLMTLVDDFNQKKITTRDAEGMALVGRAAHLLRSKHDANEAYDDAERAKNESPELFLWRAELFLEAYNYGRAEEMVREALKRAPSLAEAHLAMAQVKLAQTLDFEEAEKELQKAAAVNHALAGVYFLRAGIALRDLEIEQADRALAEGLATDPTNLELLSMKAAARFLADDKAGLTATTRAVMSLNPEYAQLYQTVAEYADWEHRYADIVTMMREAARLDPDDGRSFVTLGINQIRQGDESGGVASLDRGFRKDKLNVRAYNTLNLYERDIPADYESVDHGVFHIRYPKAERKMLERYVPAMLDEAWASMVKRYGFTPTTPVGIEIYGTREHFSVRTSGLPNVGIQGVCFGSTLAALGPGAEPFNWGNVLWHELGHVFAIQLSNAHVPRWFTEGLSEYETIARRPEWRREEDPALYEALRDGRVPEIARMNRVFTHAEDVRDITTAYYASSQISVYLVETYGMGKLAQMLKAWGTGKRTPEVIQTVLGVTPAELDRAFRAWLDVRLARYKTQFVPDLRAPAIADARKAVDASPKDVSAQVGLVLAQLAAGENEAAAKALERARSLDVSDPRVRFLEAKLALRRKDAAAAKKELEAMIAEKHDGYAVRMLLADIAEQEKDMTRAASHYEAAAKLDPTQAEPLQSLIDMAKKAGARDRELAYLQKLALIDQHDKRVWRRLLAALLERKAYADAVRVGEGAMFVDVHGAETHELYAEALLATNAPDKAIFESESALACEKVKADVAARANVVLARAYLAKKEGAKAKAARDEALRQDPNNADAKALVVP